MTQVGIAEQIAQGEGVTEQMTQVGVAGRMMQVDVARQMTQVDVL
jgi:hypothetical protein